MSFSKTLALLIAVASVGWIAVSNAQQPPNFQLVSSGRVAPASGYNGATPNFGLLTPGQSQLPQLVQVNQLNAAPHPRDAVAYALADCQSLPADSRPFQRYIWIPDGDRKKAAALNFAVNTAVSRATTIVTPVPVANGKLMRYDLRALAPRESQYAALHANWEKLAFEPYFHLTKSATDALPSNAITIASRDDDPVGSVRFKVGDVIWYRSPTHTFFILENNRWVQRSRPTTVQLVAAPAAHTNLTSAVLLQGLTQSGAALVRYDFFMTRVLSSIDGGLYYDFSGINGTIAAARKGGSTKTDQQIILEALGANEQIISSLRSDQRAAMFRSNVTGKPRQIEVFQGQGVRPGSGTGLVTMTHDVFDNDVDPARDPIRNLLNFQDRARELIAERGGTFGANGMHLFALFDSTGKLQAEAPPNVVVDHTIPRPHTGRLQAAISCIRCHGPQEGFQPFNNEVQTMLAGYLNIFGDVSSRDTVPDQLDRLAGLYSGDLSKPIRRGRDDYTDAIYRATGGMQVPEASLLVANIYQAYVYDTVDAQKACLELGYVVPAAQAVYYLNQILPPLNRDVLGISPEDPIIGALKAGLSVNRYQWEQVYPDAAFRAMKTYESSQENIGQ